ncbi:MAG TPA: pyrroloquinoline quinone biosynthesis protein PqqB [Firmicutes bacterium]|jgi:pyrroloquinoline quinone biosynthesis protein B|nr:pyrroloquinoline quinone biosynthesis protein PqqB [Bacillota bacterium]
MKKVLFLSLVVCLLFTGFSIWGKEKLGDDPFVVVLGTAQDVGYPHAGCKKECCLRAWKNSSLRRLICSIAVVDPLTKERWIIDPSPNFIEQWMLLEDTYPFLPKVVDKNVPLYDCLKVSGFLPTHAHIGHYPGMMFIGREGIGANGVPVYAMPRMSEFLQNNGPWNQLVNLNNITIYPIQENVTFNLNNRISVTAMRVPHRDEYSETVGFIVQGPNKSFAYISDINKWEVWERRIEDVVAQVDYAFLDGTFYGEGEIPGKSIEEIPHPFVVETMKIFDTFPLSERNKIYFVHLNHTNPLLNPKSKERKLVKKAGYNLPDDGTVLGL